MPRTAGAPVRRAPLPRPHSRARHGPRGRGPARTGRGQPRVERPAPHACGHAGHDPGGAGRARTVGARRVRRRAWHRPCRHRADHAAVRARRAGELTTTGWARPRPGPVPGDPRPAPDTVAVHDLVVGDHVPLRARAGRERGDGLRVPGWCGQSVVSAGR